MDDACSWTPKGWKAVEIGPSKSLKHLNSGGLAPCSQEKRPPSIQPCLSTAKFKPHNFNLLFEFANRRRGAEEKSKLKRHVQLDRVNP